MMARTVAQCRPYAVTDLARDLADHEYECPIHVRRTVPKRPVAPRGETTFERAVLVALLLYGCVLATGVIVVALVAVRWLALLLLRFAGWPT